MRGAARCFALDSSFNLKWSNLMYATQTPGRKLGTRAVAERFGVSTRSVDRWTADPALAFPQPMHINGRKYWDEGEIVAWATARAGEVAA
jgi:predicted DNA-binding transcriptional regulator AlpA